MLVSLGVGGAMKHTRVFGIGVLLGLVAWGSVARAESRHNSRPENSNSNESLIQSLRFQAEFQKEIIPGRTEELSIHLEDGTVRFSEENQKLARRIYQGRRGLPNGHLDLVATDAGKARTFIAAVRACEKLVPLGQWRLASVEHIMAFFGDLLPGYPLPDEPNKKGYLFWASASNPEEDKKNKDQFYTTPELGGERLEVQQFTRFANYLRQNVSSARSKEEKQYYVNFIKETRVGIPVICVIGKEP